jgi:hypothetical protein
MTMLQRLVLTAIALLGSAGLSLAATTPRQPADQLNLTETQQKKAYDDLYMQPFAQTPPPGFKPAIGAVIPHSIAMGRMPPKAVAAVPALSDYRFAMIKNEILVVNPSDDKIADVISRM